MKRLGGMVLVLIVVSLGTTALLRLVPGDACITALGTGATEETVAECRVDRGLDENVFVQYTDWASDVLGGDLGFAFYSNGELLSDTLEQRLPRTLFLFVYSQLIALGLAVPLGVWAAYQSGRPSRPVPRWLVVAGAVGLLAISVGLGFETVALLLVAGVMPMLIYAAARGGTTGDAFVNMFAFVLLSIPVFVLGEALRYQFSIAHDWYQLTGYAPLAEGIGAHLRSVWLPSLVLGLAGAPVYLRLLRADMAQNLQQDFVAVARAKGLSNRHILFRHVLRPSTVTLLTVGGLNIAQLVNGAIVVEFIYDFDGMGSYLVAAVARREYFAVQTIVALVAILFVLTNTIIDVVYSALDPRVRLEDER